MVPEEARRAIESEIQDILRRATYLGEFMDQNGLVDGNLMLYSYIVDIKRLSYFASLEAS